METSRKKDICKAEKIARDLIDTASRNENNCESNTCLLVYSILRDCGYRIIKIIGEQECHLYTS